MTDDLLARRGTIMVRRLRLAPGETMPWHRDPFHRVAMTGIELEAVTRRLSRVPKS